MIVNHVRFALRATAVGALVALFTLSAPARLAAQPPIHYSPTSASNNDAAADIATKNFIVSGLTAPAAKRVAERAETRRKEIAKLWLGKELPNWAKPTRLEVVVNQDRPTGATNFDFKLPANAWAPVKISLSGNLDYILSNSLPHEITHAVLADHFRQPVPRWADEGTAILSESEELQRVFDGIVHNLDNSGRLIRLDYFFAMQAYPQALEVLYAEGFSTTRFLVNRKDHATFVAFLKTGMEAGWTAAAKRHYDFDSIDDLQTDWLNSLRGATQR